MAREYLYGMRLRGYSPGCQPMDGLLRRAPGGGRYHDILIYDRPLTEKEVTGYELDFLGTSDRDKE